MKYSFRDIYNENLYSSAQVVFITGNLDIFNNIVSDRLRESCRGIVEGEINISSELLTEMGLEVEEATEDTSLNKVDFDTYLEVSKMPSVVGKWFCSVDYTLLSKKQKEQLEGFMKKPSENGILVVSIRDYPDYRYLLRNRVIAASPVTHLIQLSFPNRQTLKQIVEKLFMEHNMTLEIKALDLFILRVNDQYNSYIDLINKIELNHKNSKVTYEEMVAELRGVENYVIDDFIRELTVPIHSKKIVKSRKIYKIENALLNEFTAKQLVTKLDRKLDDLIEMRVMINKGAVPVGVRFKVETCQTRIGDDSRLSKISDYAFMKLYEQAQLTSLKDWVYMKLIISTLTSGGRQSFMVSDSEYEKVLHTLINRSQFSNHRLLNDIQIKDSVNSYIDRLNQWCYSDSESESNE